MGLGSTHEGLELVCNDVSRYLLSRRSSRASTVHGLQCLGLQGCSRQ